MVKVLEFRGKRIIEEREIVCNVQFLPSPQCFECGLMNGDDIVIL